MLFLARGMEESFVFCGLLGCLLQYLGDLEMFNWGGMKGGWEEMAEELTVGRNCSVPGGYSCGLPDAGPYEAIGSRGSAMLF